MVKKVRLVDSSTDTTKESTTADSAGGSGFTTAEKEKLLQYAEAIDWKLWEILKTLKDEQ